MAKKYFVGGTFTLFGEGDHTYDGDYDFDDAGGAVAYEHSNWVDNAGAPCQKPQDGVDEAIFSSYANIVPVDYDGSNQHTIGKRFDCCLNLDQTAIDLHGITVTKGYDGCICTKKSHTLNAAVASDTGGNTTFPCTNHTMAVGDYVTIGGTTYYNGEARVLSIVPNVSFTLDMPFILAETFSTTDTAEGRTPLQIGITADYEIVFNSNCTAYIEASHATLNIPRLIHNSETGLLHISSDTAGTKNWAEIVVQQAGTLIVANDTEFTKMIVTENAANATIIVGKGCVGPASAKCLMECAGGTIAWDSPIDLTMAGGAITYCANVDLDTTVDLAVLVWRGTFKWYGKGTMIDYEQWGGTITALGDADKVIGSGASTAYPQHGGTFDLSQAGGRVTFGSGDSINHQGGSFLPAKRNNWAIV